MFYDISKSISIDEDWLYHWIINEHMLYSVYNYGILSKTNLRKNNISFLRDGNANIGCNGSEYISVCKKLKSNSFAYQRYITHNSAFIINPAIEKINSVKEEMEIKRNKLLETFLGIKKVIVEKSIVNSPDEYLVKDKIDFKDIIGLKLPLFYDEDNIRVFLDFLEIVNCDLPIIDVDNELEIDRTKALRLLKK